MSATHPTDAERDRAAWTLLQAQIDVAAMLILAISPVAGRA